MRAELAGVLGVDPRFVTDAQAARFARYVRDAENAARRDELRRAIEARPEPESGWRSALGRSPQRWTRAQIESWLEERSLGVDRR